MIDSKKLQTSIAMATFNGARYLQEQLESFAAQTLLPDELVISDDCSTDNTLDIIKVFASSAPFKVRWTQNHVKLGYTGNFNQALMRTMGDMVFLSDQDDVWFPDKLERMARYVLDDPDALVIMNDAALTDANLNDTGLTKQGQISSGRMSSSNFVMGCCVVVRRELLDLCLPIPSIYNGHDSWIVKMAEGVGRKRVVSDVLQWYRRHEENESQYVFNTTSMLTRGLVFRHTLHAAIRGGEQHKQRAAACDQVRSFLQSVRRASNRAAAPLSSRLAEYVTYLESHLADLEVRRIACEKPRLWRLLYICKLWRSGVYERSSGIKSAARDLLLR